MKTAAPGGEQSRNANGYTELEQKALDLMLEDARWAFSGMIYGFDVFYRPGFAARGVSEILEVVPVAEIPRGDPRLTFVSVVQEQGFIYVLMEYTPDETQENRLEGWNTLIYPTADGLGSASIHGFESQHLAMETAVKEAIRGWLRKREFNRPKEIQGRVALIDFPHVQVSGVSIQASVKLCMVLKPLRHYITD